MNLYKEIGGYFEIAESAPNGSLHPDGLFVNSGRHALEYILRVQKPNMVYIPRYTCDAIIEPLERTKTAYTFYAINRELEIADQIELPDDAFILYTNYFGVKSSYSEELALKYGSRLILDCAQALFMQPPVSAHVFYSPRKFLGLPDGGIVFTSGKLNDDLKKDDSSTRMEHLKKRLELGAAAGYTDFLDAEEALSHLELMRMSAETSNLLHQADFVKMQAVRSENYTHLHEHLNNTNLIQLPTNPVGPLCYPYYASPALRSRLIENKVYIPTYWANVLKWSLPKDIEYDLASNIVALPVDQRYGKTEMERILGLIDDTTN